MQRPEQQIQKAVFAHLKQRGAPNTFAFAVPNGGYRRPIEAAILKSQGVKRGVPDIIIIKSGHCYALELKADNGKPTPAQLETMKTMEESGATVDIVFGLDGAIRWLEANGLLVGKAA